MVDTGLFFDHRKTRAWLQGEVKGLRCLNLYCYTGAFSCAFAAGGAQTVTSVDQSATYLKWAKKNFALNQLKTNGHDFIQLDVREFLEKTRAQFDLIFVDPPSFSTLGSFRERERSFQITEDYQAMLEQCWKKLADKGRLIFSTNHAQFEANFAPPLATAEEITHWSMPEDCRKGRGHRCFVFRKG